jgi:hypothetical protein
MAFRDPLDAAAALAMDLASAPVARTHEWIAKNVVLEIDPEPDRFCTIEALVDEAHRLGLRHVGRKTEGIVGRKGFVNDVFVEPTARAFVTFRNRDADAFDSIGSRYWIVSLFDDAVAIETCSIAEPWISSGKRLLVRGGTNDLARDLASHLAAVDARGPGAVCLPARDRHDVLRSMRIYFRQSISPKVAEDIRSARTNWLERALFVAYERTRRFLTRSSD